MGRGRGEEGHEAEGGPDDGGNHRHPGGGGAGGDPAPQGGGPAPGRAGGGLWDPYGYAGAHADLKRRGFLFAHDLLGHKARLKLMLALGSLKGAALREAFEEEFPVPPRAGLHRGAPRAFRRRGGLVGAAGGIGAAPGLPPSASASSSARRMSASLTGRGR